MRYTRIYSDDNGDSRFEDIDIPLNNQGIIGNISEVYPVKSLHFRENAPDYDWDFHTASARQFIILLDG